MMQVAYVPLDRFVLWLAQGWRFSGHVVEPMRGHHGAFSCLMERGE